MAASNADLTVASGVWQDLVATFAGMASVSGFVQNKGPNSALVFFGGNSQPGAGGTGGGVVLRPGEVTYGTSAHVWVCGLGGSAVVASGLNDT